MAGSPKKRARKKARELAVATGAGALPQPEPSAPARLGPADDKAMGEPGGSPALDTPAAPFVASPPPASAGGTRSPEVETVAGRDPRDAPPATLPAALLTPEVLPPADPTRTTLKRAMRRKAEQYADEALERLAAAMRNPDDRVGAPAAEKILDRAYGRPTPEIDADGAGLSVVILKFGDTV